MLHTLISVFKNRFLHLQPQRSGFAMLAVVMSLSVVMASFLSVTSLVTQNTKEIKASRQKLADLSLRSLLPIIFDDRTCSCHFDPIQNTSLPPDSLLKI